MPALKIQAKNDSADVWIYDEIGLWGITAKMFADEVKSIGDVSTIRVMINSPGGDVFDGLAIYNTLLKHKAAVNVEIDGVAASIASIIAMAGDTVSIADNGLFMIHNPWTVAFGEAKDMRKTADTLDLVREQLIGTYAGKTGLPMDEIGKLMDEETWMDSAESLDQGFADETFADQRVAASAMQRNFHRQPPKAAREFPQEPEPLPGDSTKQLAARELSIRITEAS